MKIRYVAWRNGRPRFHPGPVQRWAGFLGKDLRHKDGMWFDEAECRAFSQEMSAAISARRAELQAAGRRPPREFSGPRDMTNESGYVYFLRSGDRIKIGFSKNPWARASSLLTGLSHGIETMVLVRGSERDERRAHRYCDTYRIQGEWFDMHPRVLDLMHRSLTFGKIAADALSASPTA
jgi:hypothetical protein